MFINAKCNTCSEPTKYVTGFWDGENGEHGCLHDCKNTECLVNQLHKISESQAMKDRMHIQELNGAKGMYAGYIAAKRKYARIPMYKMAQISGCSPAEYSAYEHERKEFDPEVYRKCVEYLKE